MAVREMEPICWTVSRRGLPRVFVQVQNGWHPLPFCISLRPAIRARCRWARSSSRSRAGEPASRDRADGRLTSYGGLGARRARAIDKQILAHVQELKRTIRLDPSQADRDSFDVRRR